MSAPETVSCRWEDVVELAAYKWDLFSYDLICFKFSLADGSFVEAHEEMEGWEELCRALWKHLPGFPAVDDWFSKVAFPPFKPNLTILFRRVS